MNFFFFEILVNLDHGISIELFVVGPSSQVCYQFEYDTNDYNFNYGKETWQWTVCGDTGDALQGTIEDIEYNNDILQLQKQCQWQKVDNIVFA